MPANSALYLLRRKSRRDPVSFASTVKFPQRPFSRSSASFFALTRSLTHSPCLDRLGADSATQSGVLNFGGSGGPMEELISMLDWFHQLTGLPWNIKFLKKMWIIIICFKTSSGRKVLFGLLSEEQLKSQLSTLPTMPIFLIGCVFLRKFPLAYIVLQGSLVYWVTNSLLNIVQELALNYPCVRAKLGLPDKNNSKGTGILSLASPMESKMTCAQVLSPRDLSNLSIKLLSEGHKERALHLLKLALEKDPEYRAITKLFIAGHPTEVVDIDNLILASQWAGVAHIRQGKIAERIQARYFDGLLMLASALSNVGRKDEALKNLRLAAAYIPAYNEYLEQCENEDDSVVSGKRKIQQDRKRLGNKKRDKKKKSNIMSV
ncbi:hypothetical protein M0R45_027054 [Rubus argutus]|uniref:Uncharacterized protein n=1 Tax=Rubus argutus TaxID=59490 RepID=A0AAW1WZB1_RUBAR